MKQLCHSFSAPSLIAISGGDDRVIAYLERMNNWNASLKESLKEGIAAWIDSSQEQSSTTSVEADHPRSSTLEKTPVTVDVAEYAINDLITVPVSDGPGRDYFKTVATWLQQNPATYINITTYTLDEKMRYDNLLVGIDLADNIKQYLVSLGADANSILVSTMTSLKPGSQYQTISLVPSAIHAKTGE